MAPTETGRHARRNAADQQRYGGDQARDHACPAGVVRLLTHFDFQVAGFNHRRVDPTLRFCFRGKSGVRHDVELTDRRLARIVRRMRELPGEELFGYVDEAGEQRPIESGDVNDYLKETAGEEFTSKDFRTWAGTLLCARALRRLEPPASDAEGRRHLAQAIESVAKALGNTRAVCRKCYIHPRVIDAYLEGRLRALMNGTPEETAVVRVLRTRARREAPLATQLSRSLRARRLQQRVHASSPDRAAARA